MNNGKLSSSTASTAFAKIKIEKKATRNIGRPFTKDRGYLSCISGLSPTNFRYSYEKKVRHGLEQRKLFFIHCSH
jgi:hypothetical protein